MESDGGSAKALLTCPRDGVETRLRCSECGTPICPACFVRTAVGLRCATCGAESGPVPSAGGAGRRGPAVAALVVVVALAVAAGAWAATRGGGGGTLPDQLDEGGERIAIPRVELGSGDLPGGMSWVLDAAGTAACAPS